MSFRDSPGRLTAMPSTRRSLILLAAVPALLMGCSGPTATTSAPPPAVTSSATPIDASPTATASAPETSASPTDANCPAGEYTLQSFDVTGANGALGKGSGGDVSVEFDNGRYEIDFDDDNPIQLTTGGSSARLVTDGEIKGTYTGSGDAITFTLGRASGRATLKGDGNKSRTLQMSQVAKVIGLDGKGSATCAGDNLTITTSNGTFELIRDNG